MLQSLELLKHQLITLKIDNDKQLIFCYLYGWNCIWDNQIALRALFLKMNFTSKMEKKLSSFFAIYIDFL